MRFTGKNHDLPTYHSGFGDFLFEANLDYDGTIADGFGEKSTSYDDDIWGGNTQMDGDGDIPR